MMTATVEAFRRSLAGKDGTEIAEVAVSLFRAKTELETRLKEFQNASTEMALQYQQMRDELKGARAEIEALRKQNQHLTGIQTIQTNDLFGRSTEKTEDILDQVVNDDLPVTDPLSENAAEQDTKEKKRGNRQRVGDIIPLFDDLDSPKTEKRKKRIRHLGSPVQESCTPGSTGDVPRKGHVYQPKTHVRICYPEFRITDLIPTF